MVYTAFPMSRSISEREIVELGIDAAVARNIVAEVNPLLDSLSAAACWRKITDRILSPNLPFALHRLLHSVVFADWNPEDGPPPVWSPNCEFLKSTNLAKLMSRLELSRVEALHRWSVENHETFWSTMIDELDIVFHQRFRGILDPNSGIESPQWLPDARLNIAESCFTAEETAPAIVSQSEAGETTTWSYGKLQALTNQVANGLLQNGFQAGTAIAIDMPMTPESVAIYLGIVSAGCVVVSIADSFAASEIRTRLRISNAKGIFTQDRILRGGKEYPLYQKVTGADAPRAIVLSAGPHLSVELRADDLDWDDFLGGEEFDCVPCCPNDATNVLFSSGTTGDPKAIPWTHTTPIKCAADAWLHQNIQPGDVLAWPTNLGWMMGPWLIYASLLNRATVALFDGSPLSKEFGQFVQDAEVTMLGVVPSLVKAWRKSGCMEDCDWSAIKVFSSTGECSNADDMFYLMSLARYRPVIEYCGGTEIGGGYLTGTVVQPCLPSTFSTPAFGLDLVILDEEGSPAANGEVFIIGPSIGLSTRLLNRDHHDVYFAETPTGPSGQLLRRHGDQIEQLPGGYFRAHGRVDDTMNLGGIKASSAEIERVLNQTDTVVETAAIAVAPPDGGPSLLVIITVVEAGSVWDSRQLKAKMQKRLKLEVNPLFKIHDVVVVESLPRTASNKVMRRTLRAEYTSRH